MTDELKKSLRKKLESYEAPLPDDLFDGVMQGIGRERRKRSLRRRTTATLLMVSAAAATVALLVGIFPRLQSGDAPMAVLTNAGDSTATPTAMAQTATARQQDTAGQRQPATLPSLTSLVRKAIASGLGSATLSDSSRQLTTDRSEQSPTSATLVAENNALSPVNKAESGSNVAAATKTEPAATVEKEPSGKVDKKSSATVEKEAAASESKNDRQPRHVDVDGYRTNKKEASNAMGAHRRTSFALSMQNCFSGSGSTNEFDHYVMVDAYNTGSLKPGKYDENVGALVAEPELKAKHHTPLRAGVSMAYQMTPRLSVEAGLSYSYHSADLEQTIGENTKTGTQQLHYVGVPVNIIYKVWGGKHLDVYATGGGRVEKMVHGRQKVNGERRSVSIGSPQWSLNAGAGIEYKLGRKVGVYLEPAAGYYFDNGSSVPTIYNDKPWNAEIKVGVRLH